MSNDPLIPYLSTPFVKLFHIPKSGKEKELTCRVERLNYVYDEEGNDCATIIINELDHDAPDKAEWQEDAKLRVKWGYIHGNSAERLVYLKDLKWEFTKAGRKLTLQAYEKGATTKQTKSKGLYTDTDLPTLIQKTAEKHALKAYVQVPLKPGETASQPLKLAIAKYLNDTDPNSRFTKARNLAREADQVSGGGRSYLSQQIMSDLQFDFSKKTNVPQANKTDAHLLKEEGLKEPGGEWLAETRDDDIILKRRDYNKKPYKTYIYEGGTGELLSFTPETKNKSKLGAAVNAMFSFWDQKSKEFMQGMAQANAELMDQKMIYLSKWMRDSGLIPKAYLLKPKKREDLTGLIINNFTGVSSSDENSVLSVYQKSLSKIILSEDKLIQGEEIKDKNDVVGTIYIPLGGVPDKNYGTTNPVDNLRRPDLVAQREVTGEELKKMVTEAELTATGSVHSVTAESEEEAFAKANNPRENSDIKRNPALALIVGDPLIETGEVITFQGLGVKYSGNYYNIKCTHTVEPQSGYTTSIELARNGHNIKASSSDQAVKRAFRQINKELGVDKTSNRNRRIQTVRNRR